MLTSNVIALGPAWLADADIAIAACRAGALGMVDLEYVSDAAAARAALDKLERFTSGPFGLKAAPSLVRQLLNDHKPERLSIVLLAGGAASDLEEAVGLLRRHGVRALVEAVSLTEMLLAARLHADGLVLKGQEAGGRIGAETAFVLLQHWRRGQSTGELTTPAWVQGGIGLDTAAACQAAGATGVVLDSQLLLSRESPLGDDARALLTACDGSETLCLGESLGQAYRFYTRPNLPTLDNLRGEEDRLASAAGEPAERCASWQQTVAQRVAADGRRGLWPLGQDVALAPFLAERFGSVASIVRGVAQHAALQTAAARRLRPLAEGAPLAVSHGTRYPIVQGPMTRVSDTAAFAASVAEAGALPFLALALMREPEADKLVAETKARLGDRSWGVGILGFVPQEIRREQMQVLRTYRPPFALIAGGRPDQARELEQEGIPTYLHVPSPGLLRMFLRDGAKRFIFEGRECGGHVGPRTSFVLWELMCQVLRQHLDKAGPDHGLHVIFAGGIHDAGSAAAVAALAAGLAERGVAVGCLMGTAYLFTQEAVASGAIVPEFQEQALGCRETVLLRLSPGHEIRCVPTRFVDTFEQEKRRLTSSGRVTDELRDALDGLIVGRLRIASKGIERAPAASKAFVNLSAEEQRTAGMYMIGQVAALRERILTMAELHAEVCGPDAAPALEEEPVVETAPAARPCDVAIIGMSCFYPGAGSVPAYWENILGRVDTITEVPPTHWDWRLYYDANPQARGKCVSKWGGFLADVPFEPARFGMPPNSLQAVEPVQLLLLEGTRRVLADAGYTDRPFPRERTSVIVGIGGNGPLSAAYCFSAYVPLLDTMPGLASTSAEVMASAQGLLPDLTEDSFPGVLQNVAAGRIANRFDFGGANFAVDAACGSSLAAVYAGVRELEAGVSDMVVVAGADTAQNPFTYTALSKTHAMSPRGRCSPFDESADGIVISEGVGMLLLKRLADAERDGDTIYCVIKGMGASSDGKCKGLTAPRLDGQLRALRRAYQAAGVSPARVGLVEAHGTGTVLGDQTEVQALTQAYTESGAAPRSIPMGSVKSTIGHTKCAAGLAGLINAALALHYKVLPPVLVQRPRLPLFEGGPFYLNAEPRPWVHGGDQARCAAVSAFGFGGTNFHAVLEEYAGAYRAPASGLRRWPAELLVWRRPTRQALIEALQAVLQALERGARPDLADLAYSLWKSSPADRALPTLAIVADSIKDLREKGAKALEALLSPKERFHDLRGFCFAEQPTAHTGPMAFLFPGQGSQYPNMLAQLAMAFGEVRQAFDAADRALAGEAALPLGRLVFPPSTFTPEQEQEARRALTATEVAQPAVGAASLGMLRLLESLGLQPDFLAGHSYGEYVALAAAGALTPDDLIRLSYQRGRVISDASKTVASRMAAVETGVAIVAKTLEGMADVTVANLNGPAQTVISGTADGVKAALDKFKEQGIRAQSVPVSCAFHSPLVAAAHGPLEQALAACTVNVPQRPVFSNVTAASYPADAAAVRNQLLDHLTSPVRFQEEIEALYAAGARIFVEVGPQGVLTNLVGRILGERPHLALASDAKGRPGLVQLQHLLSLLLVSGQPVNLDRLYDGRTLRKLDPARLQPEPETPQWPAGTWLINSTRVRACHAPEPKVLGQTQPDAPPRPPREASRPAAQPTTNNGTNGAARHDVLPSPPPPPPASPMPTTTPVAAQLPREAPPPASQHRPDDAAEVMMRFQDLMSRFLDTQRSVMMTYLQDGGGAALPSAPLPELNGFHAEPERAPLGVTLPPAPALPAQETNGVPKRPEPSPVNGTTAGPAAASPPPPSNRVDRQALAAKITELVSKRTGYPPEMLGQELDLEADLGVDSIKRVEILGGLGDTLGVPAATMEAEMEKLMALKTIAGLSEYLEKKSGEATAVNGHAKDAAASHAAPPAVDVRRYCVEQTPAPLPLETLPLTASGVVLVTDDQRGLAQELLNRLRGLGQPAVLVAHGAAGAANGHAETLHADLTDPQAVAHLLDRVRAQGVAIRGLVHLLPLAEAPAGEDAATRMRREIKSLFLLARGLDKDLRQASEARRPFVAAVTTLDFAAEALPESYPASHGGVAGLLKSLAMEWPHAQVRCVDLEAETPAPTAADRLLAELGHADGPVEIGYRGEERVALTTAAAPLDKATAALALDAQSVILLTGGARGITAAMALELARRFQPTLVLVGRSPLPAAEAADTAGLTEPAELKAALLTRLRGVNGPPAPALVESAYQRLCQDREIRANLAALRQAGARVSYYEADVRDDGAVANLLAEVHERFGRLDGVLHGAGVIHDKLIAAKTPESFDAVFDTKVGGALTLCRHLDLEALQFLVFLGSVSGRFGNVGQTDYAAANEVLARLAGDLDRRCPGRVVTIAWGPWSECGMAAALEPHLQQRGMHMIPPAVGARLLADELLYGHKGECEVVLTPNKEAVTRPASNGRASTLARRAGDVSPPVTTVSIASPGD